MREDRVDHGPHLLVGGRIGQADGEHLAVLERQTVVSVEQHRDGRVRRAPVALLDDLVPEFAAQQRIGPGIQLGVPQGDDAGVGPVDRLRIVSRQHALLTVGLLD